MTRTIRRIDRGINKLVESYLYTVMTGVKNLVEKGEDIQQSLQKILSDAVDRNQHQSRD